MTVVERFKEDSMYGLSARNVAVVERWPSVEVEVRLCTLCKVTWNFREPFFLAEFSKRRVLVPIIFGSLDVQLGNPN